MRVLAGRCCTNLAGLPAVPGGGPYVTIRTRLETARQRIPAAMGRYVPEVRPGSPGGLLTPGECP